MNAKKIITELQKTYPLKRIILDNKKNPREIICEIEGTSEHPEFSIAIAVIDSSAPHFHKKAEETYEVLQGTLRINIGNNIKMVTEGESLVIKKEEVHSAIGDETWVRVTSIPGWDKEDHTLV